MSDLLTNGALPGQAGQPATSSPQNAETPSANAAENPGGETTQYVTKNEAQQLAKDAAADAVRQMQSLSDKAQAKIEKQINSLKAVGITATPEQVRKMVATEEANESAGEISNPGAAQQQAMEPPLDPVVRKAFMIMEEAGVKVTAEDPEFSLIDSKTEDPEVFLDSVRAATNKMAARLNVKGSPARMPAVSSNSKPTVPNHAGKTGTNILDEYYKEHPL